MGKNMLSQQDVRDDYFFTCKKCGKEVFGDFTVDDKPDFCDSCKRIEVAKTKVQKTAS